MRAALALLLIGAAPALAPADYRADAGDLAGLIRANYAYPEHWPGGIEPTSPVLDAERDAVHDRASLLHYAGDMVAALADHHAVTRASFPDDWGLVPSFADLWIEGDRITAVRANSPAAAAGVVAGDRLLGVDGVSLDQAIAAYWEKLGLTATGERRDVAARVLAAGRRDRPRLLRIAHGGRTRDLSLPNLYAAPRQGPPVIVAGTTLLLNDSLGDQGTIAAFDRAMADMPAGERVTIDLTDTPGGGNTSVARAMMGWFVRRATSYQVHDLPAEERDTGAARQ